MQLSVLEQRDLYDVWMLLQNSVGIDEALLAEKLREESLAAVKFPGQQEYEVGLKSLLAFLPPYDQVKNEVSLALEKARAGGGK
ncbi:MAG: hypothetical protein AB1626_00090 [Candidatus Micrarchaeota archaeon]